MQIYKSESNFILPANLLEKAFKEHYPEANFILRTEPFFAEGEPHWAFDNYRCNGAVGYNPSHLFFTQPGWGSFFEEKVGRNKAKCVTYACDPDFHKPMDVGIKYDVGFIGQTLDLTGERQIFLKAIDKNFKMYISDNTPTQDLGAAYSACKVIFNQIRYEEINIRFFEALAMGAQVVSYSPALHLFATEGEHYLTYKTPEEAVEKVGYLLKNEAKRKRMAKSAREHVIKYHTYRHRAKEMLDFLQL
jgi:hypothetical protein